jgi:hypothetical protein
MIPERRRMGAREEVEDPGLPDEPLEIRANQGPPGG